MGIVDELYGQVVGIAVGEVELAVVGDRVGVDYVDF